jgi:hypothetical protein
MGPNEQLGHDHAEPGVQAAPGSAYHVVRITDDLKTIRRGMFVRVNRPRMLTLTQTSIQTAGKLYEVINTAVGEGCILVRTTTDHPGECTFVGFEDICELAMPVHTPGSPKWVREMAKVEDGTDVTIGAPAPVDEVWAALRYGPKAVDDPNVLFTMGRNEHGQWVRYSDHEMIVAGYRRLVKDLQTQLQELRHGAQGDSPQVCS